MHTLQKIKKNKFGKALKKARSLRGLSQEDFSLVSSRTYISSLERSLKSPTLQKVDVLAECLEVHPLTLLAMSYSNGAAEMEQLLEMLRMDCTSLGGMTWR